MVSLHQHNDDICIHNAIAISLPLSPMAQENGYTLFPLRSLSLWLEWQRDANNISVYVETSRLLYLARHHYRRLRHHSPATTLHPTKEFTSLQTGSVICDAVASSATITSVLHKATITAVGMWSNVLRKLHNPISLNVRMKYSQMVDLVLVKFHRNRMNCNVIENWTSLPRQRFALLCFVFYYSTCTVSEWRDSIINISRQTAATEVEKWQ